MTEHDPKKEPVPTVLRAPDFIMIGGQKCGTTALFEYTRKHPDIFMPGQKETAFFAHEDIFLKGRDWYIKTYFSGAGNRVCGEASTHYMYYRAVPSRMHKLFPGVKLVAILRNPIDRCYSHYRMAVRRGIEDREFEEVIEDLMRRDEDFPETQAPGTVMDESRYYLTFGKYGEMLEAYLRYFRKDGILLLFSEDLRKSPERTMERLFRFLKVEPSFRPPDLGKMYHASGIKRIPWLEKLLFRTRFIRDAVRVLSITRRNYETLRFRVEMLNIRPVPYGNVGDKERALLKDFYRGDVEALERNFDIKVPWKDFA